MPPTFPTIEFTPNTGRGPGAIVGTDAQAIITAEAHSSHDAHFMALPSMGAVSRTAFEVAAAHEAISLLAAIERLLWDGPCRGTSGMVPLYPEMVVRLDAILDVAAGRVPWLDGKPLLDVVVGEDSSYATVRTKLAASRKA